MLKERCSISEQRDFTIRCVRSMTNFIFACAWKLPPEAEQKPQNVFVLLRASDKSSTRAAPQSTTSEIWSSESNGFFSGLGQEDDANKRAESQRNIKQQCEQKFLLDARLAKTLLYIGARRPDKSFDESTRRRMFPLHACGLLNIPLVCLYRK